MTLLEDVVQKAASAFGMHRSQSEQYRRWFHTGRFELAFRESLEHPYLEDQIDVLLDLFEVHKERSSYEHAIRHAVAAVRHTDAPVGAVLDALGITLENDDYFMIVEAAKPRITDTSQLLEVFAWVREKDHGYNNKFKPQVIWQLAADTYRIAHFESADLARIAAEAAFDYQKQLSFRSPNDIWVKLHNERVLHDIDFFFEKYTTLGGKLHELKPELQDFLYNHGQGREQQRKRQERQQQEPNFGQREQSQSSHSQHGAEPMGSPRASYWRQEVTDVEMTVGMKYLGTLGVTDYSHVRYADVNQSYRKIAMANHPDRFPGDSTREKKMKEANEAWGFLKNRLVNGSQNGTAK